MIFVLLMPRLKQSDKIYILGSYAGGKPNPYSDIDVGIIVRKMKGDYLATMKKSYKLRRKIDVRIEPHLIIVDSDVSGFGDEVKKTSIEI